MSRWIRWAILLALALPVVDHVAIALTTHGDRVCVEAQNWAALEFATEAFRADHGRYPSEAEALGVLIRQKEPGPYLLPPILDGQPHLAIRLGEP